MNGARGRMVLVVWLVLTVAAANAGLAAEGPARSAAETPPATEAAQAPPEKPQVMVLGTFHFRGSATDRISVTMGDVLTPERQAEIEEVVERLASFAPTRIMVEVTPDRQEEIDATYRAYVAGEHELNAGETEQIAMRLARKLGHDRIWAVDHAQGMDFQRMMAAGQQAGQTELLGWFQAKMGEIQETFAREQGPGRTILDALRFHNGEWGHAGNGLYLAMAPLGTTDDPAGAEVIAGWYQRNLKIYSNVARSLAPGDRALVVFGSGHLAHLASFFDQNPGYEWVSALEVLGEPE